MLGWQRRLPASSSPPCLVGAFFSAGAQAAPGDLDPTFSGDGKQTTDFGFGASSAAATVRPAGRQDRRGRRLDAVRRARDDFALARYNPNGSLDTSFSGDGKQTTDFGRGHDGASGGGAPGRRQDRRGRHDSAAERRLRARPLQPERLARHELLRRRQADDRLRGPPTGRTGWRSRPTARSSWSAAAAPAAATSRSPATTRTARSTRASPATASRRPTSGAHDDGERGGAPGGRQDRRGRRRRRRLRRRLRARPLQPERLARHELLRRRQADDRLRGRRRARTGWRSRRDGKIVAVGGRQRRRDDFALARYNPNGSLDTSFSGDGKQTTDFGGYDGASGVALQATARSSRSAATAPTATSRSPATTRTARSTRASPATASRRPTSAGSTRASGVALQADGKIVAVGVTGGTARRLRARPLQPERLARHELLRRRQADDRLRRAPTTARAGWRSRRDGKIVAVGGAAASTSDFALARYNPNGSLDTSFSGDGKQTTDFGGFDAGDRGGDPGATARSSWSVDERRRDDATSRSPATTPTARSTRASPATASRRPTSGASTGASGGGDPGGRQDRRGRRAWRPGERLRARPLQPERLARHELLRRRQADDRLRGLDDGRPGWRSRRRQDRRGRARRPRGSDFALARYNPNGSLDTSFSGDGKQTTDFGGPTRANGVALQGDGKIVAVGPAAARRRLRARPLQPQRLARHELLRRRQADDRLRGLRDGANGVALQADGKIVAVGVAGGGDTGDFALARYNPNGSLDRASPATASRRPTSGARRRRERGGAPGDGKIVAVGGGLGTDRPAISRSLAISERLSRARGDQPRRSSGDGRGWFRTSDLSRVKRWSPRHGWASLRASGCARMCVDVRGCAR